MEEIIRMLEEELSLVSKLLERAAKQKLALKENLNGKAVAEATGEVEGILSELSAFEKRKEELIKGLGCPTLADAVRREPYSREKTRARKCLRAIEDTLKNLRQESATSQALLEKNARYLAFSLNVLAGAQAGPGYDAGDTAPAGTQGRKLFDETV